MFRNPLKARLQSGDGGCSFGIFIGFPSTAMVEMAGYNGFDAVVIDNEHGMFSEENVEHMIIAAENAGLTPLVRVVSGEPAEILKAMDRGARGVHVPQVDTREKAEKIVEAVKYPPMGKRGAAFSMRAARYGTIPVDQYLEQANEQSLVVIHVESEKAVANLEDIVTVKGIDMIYIGPTDLSVSLGCQGNIEHPDVLAAIDQIRETTKKHGIKLGIHVKDGDGARKRKEWGADYVCLTVTSLINGAFAQYIRTAKS